MTEQTTYFRYSINSGTLRGFNLSIEEEIDIAAQAGYDGIEPWITKIEQYLEQGGCLRDLRKRIEDHGLCVPGGCAFFPWIVDDEIVRKHGIEQMKREMDLFREIGATHITATAWGAKEQRLDQFDILGERYRTILEIGLQKEIIPQLEVWGHSKTMTTLADVFAIASYSGHTKSEFLLDIYHLYRGGTPFQSLALLNTNVLSVFHFNDYPNNFSREQLEDKHRVYPGDGNAPLAEILRILYEIGFNGFLSFEVFNPTYWETNNPLHVAKTGLEKMKAIKWN
ncbi:MAG: sugar phosphate isomerase/epimerase [Planctomycetaceae bacterium]|jgi:sugar phosphate isomerase/epimerase|nr:sugar phosphate isomerase/epimerase [Planctomycetaceae bacterium]